MGEQPGPVDVFISHASADKAQRARLEVHLGLMVRQKLIRTWHRAQVEPGQEPAREIAALLDAARMVLLLVSAHFLAQDDCYEVEMKRALERHDAGEARVVPILVHDCDWGSAPFARLNPLPSGGKPVTSWRNRNEAWATVARGVREAAEQLRGPENLPVAMAAPPPMQGGGYGRSPRLDEAFGLTPEPGEAPLDAVFAARPARRRSLLDREEDVVLLLRELVDGPVLIWSPDPAGNLSLARHLAQELAPHYGPEVEVDLRGSTWRPLGLGDAMWSVIDRLNPMSRVYPPPPGREALRNHYQAVIAMYRPILIFSDPHDRAQLAPLLPPPGVIVLITSERPVELPGVHTQQVEPLALLGEADPQDAPG